MTKPATDETPVDILPTIDDDVDPPAAPDAAAEARDAITARYRAIRDGKTEEGEAESEAGAAESAEADPADAVPAEMSKPVPAADAPAVESAEGQETDEIPLLIDGVIVKKPLKEVAALAQKGLAGDNRLDEAKRLLKLAEERELRSRAPEHPPGASPLQEPAETDPPTRSRVTGNTNRPLAYLVKSSPRLSSGSRSEIATTAPLPSRNSWG